jgi:hypothetical protein
MTAGLSADLLEKAVTHPPPLRYTQGVAMLSFNLFTS